MDDKRKMVTHLLAALAYRTQKALREAPPEFGEFRMAPKVRTPHELIRHMDSVLGYAQTFFVGGRYDAPEFRDFSSAVAHFHETLANLARHLEIGTELHEITLERILQGPCSDAMSHAGQLAMLRRLAGCPVPPENFIFAAVSAENLGPEQPLPVQVPDKLGPDHIRTYQAYLLKVRNARSRDTVEYHVAALRFFFVLSLLPHRVPPVPALSLDRASYLP